MFEKINRNIKAKEKAIRWLENQTEREVPSDNKVELFMWSEVSKAIDIALKEQAKEYGNRIERLEEQLEEKEKQVTLK